MKTNLENAKNQELLEDLEIKIKEKLITSYPFESKGEIGEIRLINEAEREKNIDFDKNVSYIKKGVYFQIGRLKKAYFFYFTEMKGNENYNKQFRIETSDNLLNPNFSSISDEENDNHSKEMMEEIIKRVKRKEIFFDEVDRKLCFKR